MQFYRMFANLRRLPVVLFVSSIVFAAISLGIFNYEIWIKKPVATEKYSLPKSKDLNYSLDETPQNIRITSEYEKKLGQTEVKVPLYISVFWRGELLEKLERFPRYGEAGGTRWGDTVSGYWNYGLIHIDKPGKYTLSITPGKEVKYLTSFEIIIRVDATDLYFEIFSFLFLVCLFFSIYYRETIFKNKYLAFLPYTLFAFIVLLTVSCSV